MTSQTRSTSDEIDLGDGTALLLRRDGTIDLVDDEGNTTKTWTIDDPEWLDQARAFGPLADRPTRRS